LDGSIISKLLKTSKESKNLLSNYPTHQHKVTYTTYKAPSSETTLTK